MLNRRRMLVRPSCIDNNMMGFIPHAMMPEYVLRLMGRIDFGRFVNPGAVPSVNESQLGEEKLVCPPLSEQTVIVEHLVKATADIDAAIARARRQIELVQEYRTRLIADVVTGELDVREAAALLPEEADEEEPIDRNGPLADADDVSTLSNAEA